MREVSEIEARLKRHRDDNRYIDNQIERLETLILRMKGVTIPRGRKLWQQETEKRSWYVGNAM